MYQTSQTFKDNIYALSRSIKGRVTFDISDTTISTDTLTTTVTSEFALSNKAQLTDKVRACTYKLATLETNRFLLDGSFTFADDTITNNGNLGWCSNPLCDATGAFSTNQVLTFNFGNTHSSAGITVTFEPLTGEYATDFDVIAYDASNAVISTTSITGNTLVQLQANGQFFNYKRIDVVIKKWSVPNRRARVAEVDFGIVQVYTNDNLVSLNYTEEMDLLSGLIPSPEFKFSVDNSSKQFNILNPTGFYKYLQQRQLIQAELGLDLGGYVEWVPLGNFLLWDWTSDEGTLTASFTARTYLDFMNNIFYQNLTAKTNYSLYQFAVDIFTLCGVSNYVIDTSLKNIYTNALVQNANCRDILQMIAIAGCANIYITRDNKIMLKCMSSTMGAINDTITMDEMYDKPKIELVKVVKTINVTYFTDLNTSAVVTVNSSVNLGETVSVENNTLINTSAQATTVANWLLQQSNLRSKYTLNWRGNPSHELLDVLSIENDFGSNMNAYVTKTVINYQGYLSAQTEAIGVAN